MITLTITPNENIDYEKMSVIDNNLVSTRSFERYEAIDVLEGNDFFPIRVSEVSLFDHLLVEGEKRFKILNLHWK